MLTCLPGRVAVLVQDPQTTGAVSLPSAILERFREMERPPVPLLKGMVAAVGAQRGRTPMPRVGDEVWVRPKPGLIVAHHDLDLPDLGADVPLGHTLRLYGVGEAWDDQVLGIHEHHAETEA